jgi:hypothetical protein
VRSALAWTVFAITLRGRLQTEADLDPPAVTRGKANPSSWDWGNWGVPAGPPWPEDKSSTQPDRARDLCGRILVQNRFLCALSPVAPPTDKQAGPVSLPRIPP